jgi:hypothetical protein
VDALLRGDIKSRYEAYQIAVGGNNGPGWMARNEVRVLEDMDPLPGLDEIYVPAAPAAPKSGDAPADKPQKPAKNMQSIVKAMRIEWDRAAGDDEFLAWAHDYLDRMGAPHLFGDIESLGVEGAIDQWLKS